MTIFESKKTIILADNDRTMKTSKTILNDTSKLLPSKLLKDISTSTSATTNTTFSTDTNITEEITTSTIVCTSSVLHKEIIILIKLIIPIIIVQLCNVCPTIIITSYIGYNYGSLYLQSYTLGISICNIFVLVIIEGIYRSLETLLPQSYGSYNYNEMQYTVLRAIICCFIILIPITIILLYNVQSLLLYLNEDVESSKYASYWYSIYCIEVPFNALYQILSCFLSAQHIVLPQSIISIFCSTIVLLVLVNYLCPIYGFIGTSISMVVTTIIQLILLVSYTYIFQPHHPETWSSSKLIIVTTKTNTKSTLSILYENIQYWYNTIFDTSKVYYFISLGFGGILASSYWIYWELLSLMIGSMSSSNRTTNDNINNNNNNVLAIFTIPTQVLNIIFMIPYGIGIGMTIRIGNLLSYYPHRAKLVCYYGTILSIVLYGIISIITYYYRYSIYTIFTIDPILINGCEEIWMYVVIYSFNMCIYAMNMGIATSLGQQGFAGCLCILFLHCLILPIVYIKVIRYHPTTTNTTTSSLQDVWKIICFAYVPINCILFIKFFLLTNWDTMSQSVRIREGIIPFKVNETVSLSSSSCSGCSNSSSSSTSSLMDNYDDNDDYDVERNKENSTTGSNNNNNNNNLIRNHKLYYQLRVKENKSMYGTI